MTTNEYLPIDRARDLIDAADEILHETRYSYLDPNRQSVARGMLDEARTISPSLYDSYAPRDLSTFV